MLEDLLTHPQTKRQLDAFIARPHHALGLFGPKGAGKQALALAVASRLLGQDLADTNSASLMRIAKAEGKQDIAIDDIRAMRNNLRLVQPGRAAIRRVVLIEEAQNMNQEAQNALLKSLEEPTSDTVFILTLESPSQLLPTVISRTQKISVMPVSLVAAKKFFGRADIEADWQLSRGLPGLLFALANNQEHVLRAKIEQAKKFLQSSRYERALLMIRLSKDKAELGAFLEALSLILRPLYRAQAASAAHQAFSLVGAFKQVDSASKDLAANVSPRLICLKLSLNLPV